MQELKFVWQYFQLFLEKKKKLYFGNFKKSFFWIYSLGAYRAIKIFYLIT